MEITRYANPELLWLLLLLLPVVAWYVYITYRGSSSIKISTVTGVEKAPKTFRYYLRHLPFLLRCSAIVLFIIALARPQNSEHGTLTTTEGIDIMLVMDVSTSMLARDFRPDRITASREVASQFIMDRPGDRIGIVVFAGEAFTQSPLTTDKRALLNLMSQVRSGIIEDGTAIGNGLATAVNRLIESDAKSKVIVLLTDGVNNAGQITPITAAEIAAMYGIKVYTVGVGTMGTAPYPTQDIWGNVSYVQMRVEIDEKILHEISQMTGGEYFRATDNNTLAEIYNRINSLETSRIETTEFTKWHELYTSFVLWGLILLVTEFLLRFTILRRLP